MPSGRFPAQTAMVATRFEMVIADSGSQFAAYGAEVVNYDELRDLAQRVVGAADRNPHPAPSDEDRDMLGSARAAAQRAAGIPDRVPWAWVPEDWLSVAEAAFTAIATALEP